ncbi:hypothetical protein FACS1894137_00050 [Spirochaetia bacterium]|nr:hypothetical protein FACS1894137_00050 [Spirochaetia bacterium]
MIAQKNPEIRKAVDTLYELSADPAVRAEYEHHEKARRDWINGMNGARQEGRQEVVDLIKSGKTPEEAMRILGVDTK